jgi:hypothetical protein
VVEWFLEEDVGLGVLVKDGPGEDALAGEVGPEVLLEGQDLGLLLLRFLLLLLLLVFLEEEGALACRLFEHLSKVASMKCYSHSL